MNNALAAKVSDSPITVTLEYKTAMVLRAVLNYSACKGNMQESTAEDMAAYTLSTNPEDVNLRMMSLYNVLDSQLPKVDEH